MEGQQRYYHQKMPGDARVPTVPVDPETPLYRLRKALCRLCLTHLHVFSDFVVVLMDLRKTLLEYLRQTLSQPIDLV